MDANRFDALSRNLALATDRRSVVRGATGGGFLALLGLLIGRKGVAAADDQPVECTWEIEAHGSVGPNQPKSYNGILDVVIDPDGDINKGSYTLVDAAWNPLLDSGGNPIVFDVVGSSHLKDIHFRVEHDGCDELAFTGVNRFHVRDCKTPMSGSFQGPELVDLGGWRTRRRLICPPCRDVSCPKGDFLDSETCECIPKECPGGHKVCGDVVCVPDPCPEGTVYDEERCVCGCEKKRCKPDEIWCPYACKCLPPDPCKEFECPPGYVHYLVGDGICICIEKPCPERVICAEGEILIYNGEECKCIGKCKERKCKEGYIWDKELCGCVKRCVETECPEGETWAPEICKCAPGCLKLKCPEGSVWDDAHCQCLPQGCPPILCLNETYVIDEKTCQCVCVEQLCAAPRTWDSDKCDCICPPTVCSINDVFNPETCACEPGPCSPQQCEPRFEWNPDLCKCVCAIERCADNYEWSIDSCSCVCTLTGCDRGYTFDPLQCYCNPERDPCSTAPDCPAGLTRSPLNCQCYCPDGEPICGPNCPDESSSNCGECGTTCKYGCCQGKCCIG